MSISNVSIGDRTGILVDKLVNIWEASVRATHFFLTENDIIDLIPEVYKGIQQIPILLVEYNSNDKNTCIQNGDSEMIIGFAGVLRDKLEMLFISPDYFGKGYGYQLVTKCLNEYHICYVDVNEQNPKALQFYQRQGFKVFDRSEHDDANRPFPILHLKL